MSIRYAQYTINNGTDDVPILLNVNNILAYTITEDGSGNYYVIAITNNQSIVIDTFTTLADAEAEITSILSAVNA